MTCIYCGAQFGFNLNAVKPLNRPNLIAKEFADRYTGIYGVKLSTERMSAETVTIEPEKFLPVELL